MRNLWGTSSVRWLIAAFATMAFGITYAILSQGRSALASQGLGLIERVDRLESELKRLRSELDSLKWVPGYLHKMHNEGLLGDFVRRKKNVVYTAETDGFIIVYSGGNSPPEFEVHVGGTLRTRAQVGYLGAACPARRGQEWLVKTVNDANGPDVGVIVFWIPMQTPW
jgi:hypothetical protein